MPCLYTLPSAGRQSLVSVWASLIMGIPKGAFITTVLPSLVTMPLHNLEIPQICVNGMYTFVVTVNVLLIFGLNIMPHLCKSRHRLLFCANKCFQLVIGKFNAPNGPLAIG